VAVELGIAGVAVAEEEAAAVFFMGLDGAGGAAREPAGLEDGAPALAVLGLLVAGAFDGAAGVTDLTGLATETFFAAGAACFATDVFLTAGFAAGLALAAGFFTVTGSFDELERTFNGCLLPCEPLRAIRLEDSTLSGCSPVANLGVIPPKASQKRVQSYAESHTSPR